MTAPILDVDSLSVHIDRHLIVNDVTFHVEPGEWLTVIGPNGAGKSTLLAAIAGLLPCTGTITLAGRVTTTIPRRTLARTLGVVAQNPTLPPGMSVLDYVLLGRTPHIRPLGRESHHDIAVAEAVCDRLSLTRFLTRELGTLSGGERQRAYLARALAQLDGADSGLLLLDEPTSALDIGHQQDVLELVETLRAETGLTIVSTMHDLSIAGEYSERMLLLADGRVAATGTPDDVLTEENLLLHYGASVRVVESQWGPIVVPARRDR